MKAYEDAISYLKGITQILETLDKEEGTVKDIAKFNVGILTDIQKRIGSLIDRLKNAEA